MTRVFPFALLLLLAAPAVFAGELMITLPKDQCLAMDKNNDPVSALVDDNGNAFYVHVDENGRLLQSDKRRDPAAAPECAYVVCGGPKDPNHITACKTGKKEAPQSHEGIMPAFIKLLTPKQKAGIIEGFPGVIGIRG